MQIKFLIWNINKSTYTAFKDSLAEILKSNDLEILNFFEAQNLNDRDIEQLGYKKIVLKEVEPAEKTIKLFYKTGLAIDIKNVTGFTESLKATNFNPTVSMELVAYLIEQAKDIGRTETIATLEAFEFSTHNDEFLYVSIHIPSKVFQDDQDQLQTANAYKRYIFSMAQKYKNRVVIAGDFNMKPFDYAMVEPMGFFAFASAKFVSDAPTFTLASREMPLYNPSWRLLGDYSEKTAANRTGGSIFFKNAKQKKSRVWHLYDQVLLTKTMYSQFEQNSLKVVETQSLVADAENLQLPNAIDHLPITFTLNI
jgi:hypothetical protein